MAFMLHESLGIAFEWSRENEVKINASRSASNATTQSLTEHLHGWCRCLENRQCQDTKGVTLCSGLTWKVHVDNIVTKASKRVHMYQLKRAGVSKQWRIQGGDRSDQPPPPRTCPDPENLCRVCVTGADRD